MNLIRDVFVLFVFLMFVLYAVFVVTAVPARKPVIACAPVHITVSGVGTLWNVFTNAEGGKSREYQWQDGIRMWCLKSADQMLNH